MFLETQINIVQETKAKLINVETTLTRGSLLEFICKYALSEVFRKLEPCHPEY